MVAKKKMQIPSPGVENGGGVERGPQSLTIGDRVRFGGPRLTGECGTLLEDYASFIVTDRRLDRDWAPPRRWAVALDSGRLAFADDAEIEPVAIGSD
ncbi:hypothetical protein NY08_2186 [Rhodococcus sp. B7740]|uniref:hypothetical protein n=1 Tax=Rhodococcus sp. B7740 TaxID=1564114 RepID=UPI0005D9FE24|nr:hypothetical protein [Rhodococcus sp. B7740]AJW40214.1 hypothetical protein NY08_2186 [Rhodococcus sp. B7740]